MSADPNDILLGDVCYLRSGSPKLTVVGKTHAGIEVVWIMYGSDQLHRTTEPPCRRRPST